MRAVRSIEKKITAGILPAVISPYVVQKIGVSAARELFLTAGRFGAAKAREIGLVHAVVSEDELDPAVDGYVRELLTSAPGAITGAKVCHQPVTPWSRHIA